MAQDTPRPADFSPGWARLGTLPVAAGLLVFLNGLYILLVAFGNITDFGTNQPFVQHVLSMDTTNFGAEPGTNLDPDVMWRAIENETVQNIAYLHRPHPLGEPGGAGTAGGNRTLDSLSRPRLP